MPTADAIQRADWGDRHVKMAFVARHPECRPFVADADGAIVGTGVTTINGPVAWIGTIWVDPAWRGHGLGTALTEATIEAAEAAGCRALVLVATEAGRPLYERFGFAVQARVPDPRGARPRPAARPTRASGRTGRPICPRWRPSTRPPPARTGRTSSSAFAAPDTTRCLDRADGRLGGFVLRAPWGGGATVAPDPDDAMAILRARRLAAGPDKRIRAGLLESNTDGVERLLADGWSDVWGAPRMLRGEMPAWQPNAIWGQFDHAIG